MTKEASFLNKVLSAQKNSFVSVISGYGQKTEVIIGRHFRRETKRHLLSQKHIQDTLVKIRLFVVTSVS